MSLLKQIPPEEAARLVREGAVLVDVREPYELAAERIAGAIELPLSGLAQGLPADLPQGRAPIFLCASGARTLRNSAALAEIAGTSPAYGLAGGIVAWKQAGYPTARG
jgi:rhodanese-related sulfurtransferase